MSRYVSKAKDEVTITVEYPRPLFSFPSLSGEYGNPREYFRMAVDSLRGSGFRREAKELDSHKKDAYATHFNTIARFLDYTNSQSQSEDDEYIYIKVKKGSESIEQPRVFSMHSVSELKELFSEGHDFSTTNCYGRNHLHYIDDLASIKLLVEKNKEKQWFDIFHLDVFNSTLLHGNRDMRSFAYILDEMHSENPELAEQFLFGHNVFGKNAYADFLQKCNEIFNPRNSSVSLQAIEEICEVLKVLGKVDSTARDEFISKLDEVEKAHPNLKEGGYKQLILKIVLEADLPINEEAANKRIIKL